MIRSSSVTSRCSSNTRPTQIHVAVGSDREVRAVHRVIARQQEPVQLLVMRRRIRHEIHLVAQRALMQIEIDRRRVAAVTTEPHVPARDLGVVLDGLHPFLACHRAFEVRGDQRMLLAEYFGIERWVAVVSHNERGRGRRDRRTDVAGARQSCSTNTDAIAPRLASPCRLRASRRRAASRPAPRSRRDRGCR